MLTGSLFSGYLGLDLAVREVFPEAETAFVADIDPGACKVLAHRAPDAPNLGDVSTVDWTPWAQLLIAVLTAGFPCQDVSAAGKRAGLKAGTRTGLWHEVVRAIVALRPPLVFLENVRGLLSARGDEPTEALLAAWATRDAADRLLTHLANERVIAAQKGDAARVQRIVTATHRAMGVRKRAVARARRADSLIVRAVGTVLGSLADLGYDAAWCGLRAADVGAPHGRWRIFILAWPADATGESWSSGNGDRGVAALDLRTAVAMLPTPRATDGTKGGPRQRGSSGDLMLPSAVALLPTPDASPHKYRINGDSQQSKGLEALARRGELPLLPTPAAHEPGGTLEQCRARLRAHDGRESTFTPLSMVVAQLLPTPTTEPTTGNGHARNLGGEARLLPTPTVMDHVGSGGNPHTTGTHGTTLTDATARQPDQWGKYGPAIRRWEQITRPAPAPTEIGPKGNPRLSCHFDEWLMGLPAGWITDVPGITHNETLKLCGNGVVLQQGAEALRWLLAVRERALGGAA